MLTTNTQLATISDNAISYPKSEIESYIDTLEKKYTGFIIEPEYALSLREERADCNKILTNLSRKRIDTIAEYLAPYQEKCKDFEKDFKAYEKRLKSILSEIDSNIEKGKELQRNRRKESILKELASMELPEGVSYESIDITDSMLVHSNKNWRDELEFQIEERHRLFIAEKELVLSNLEKEKNEASNYNMICDRIDELNAQYGINIDRNEFYQLRSVHVSVAFEILNQEAKKLYNTKQEVKKESCSQIQSKMVKCHNIYFSIEEIELLKWALEVLKEKVSTDFSAEKFFVADIEEIYNRLSNE